MPYTSSSLTPTKYGIFPSRRVSRGAWLATMLGMMLFFGLLFRRRQYRVPVLVVLVVLAAGAIAFVIKTEQSQKRLQNAFTPGTRDDTSVRLYLWKPTVAMWLDHFWLGVGPAHYDERFRAYRPPAVQARPWRAHN